MGSHFKTRSKLARAAARVCMEGLESRQMLTTLQGGDTFIYKDSKDLLFRISVLGNTRAEFVAAAVDDTTNTVTLGDLAASDATDGADLFAIYVDRGDWDSVISIEQVTVNNANGRITPSPFSGNISLTTINLRDGQFRTMDANGGTGNALLGARTKAINGNNNSGDRPILSVDMPGQIGILQPPPSGQLQAGLVVEDGADLGKFLFDGTITGIVDVRGSMNMFYAGNILTGDAFGAFSSGFPGGPAPTTNFNVDGDLRDLIISGSIGTDNTGNFGVGDDPLYLTGAHLRVGGHLGQIHVADAFAATLDVNDQDKYFHDEPQLEVESRGTLGTFDAGFLNDTLGAGDDQFHNDTFDTAQYLGNLSGGIVLDGELDASTRANFQDFTDYYGVSLLAGQSVTVQLTDTTFSQFLGGNPVGFVNLVNIGVFDPDGRLIATDYSDVDPTGMIGQPFTFVADRPGIYRFAVAEFEDADFTGPGGEFDPPGHIGFDTYELSIKGAGNLAIGAVSTGGELFDPEVTMDGILAHNGDIGALAVGGNAIFTEKFGALGGVIPGPNNQDVFNIRTLDGGLRAIVAGQIGRFFANSAFEGPDLSIKNGDVGLLRSTNGVLSVNPTPMLLDSLTTTDPTLVVPKPDLPRNYQMVDANTRFEGALIADQKIGMVLAGDMASLSPSVFHVNADNFGADGVIDLIDVTGDFGTLNGGGPHITTGPKGNVRYINVGGNLFRDEAFGGGQPDITQFNPGQSATITDDSGAILKISPGTGGTLGVLTYGIRGSGGSAIVLIQSDQSVNIRATSKRNSSPAEIGLISDIGAGGSVDVSGKSRVDIFRVNGGDFNRIVNNTPGEIVSTAVGNVNIMQAQNLGISDHSTPAIVIGRQVQIPGAAYPFLNQTTAISAASINQAKSYGQIGNLNVSGDIGTVTADTNNTRSTTTFEGITGPIFAGGNITSVNIGAGIMPSGTGNLAKAGVFANGAIGAVRGRKTANIRGNIVSQNSIGRIDLVNGGSIINADILIVNTLSDARELDWNRIAATEGPDTVDRPVYDLGQITLTGDSKGKVNPRRPKPQFRGGIIGSFFSAPDIGPTILKSGSFGIINSAYTVTGDGVISKFQTDGYGLRNVLIVAGARIGDMIASGKGESLSTALFSKDVRQSETETIDPFFGTAPTALTDLHKFLGTSKNVPTLEGITDAGIIAGVSASASRDLNSLIAWKLVGNSPAEKAIFNFANHIKKIQIAEDVFHVSITTGQLDLFKVGHDVINLDMTVAGPIDTISIGHDYESRSRIRAIGPDGSIDSIFVGHDLDGNMSAENTVGHLKVNGLYNGDVTENGVHVPER
jgi:hypothetical protein